MSNDHFVEIEPRNPGHMRINGEITGRLDWDGYCAGRFEFSTNGPQGGDAGHGSYLRMIFTNSGSTCIEVEVDGVEHKLVNSVAITFRGDAELTIARDVFEFLSRKLKSIQALSH
jgi:hypothetical protein